MGHKDPKDLVTEQLDRYTLTLKNASLVVQEHGDGRMLTYEELGQLVRAAWQLSGTGERVLAIARREHARANTDDDPANQDLRELILRQAIELGELKRGQQEQRGTSFLRSVNDRQTQKLIEQEAKIVKLEQQHDQYRLRYNGVRIGKTEHDLAVTKRELTEELEKNTALRKERDRLRSKMVRVRQALDSAHDEC